MDMNKLLIVGVVILVVLSGLYGVFLYTKPSKVHSPLAFDPSNVTFELDQNRISLVNGKSGDVEMFGEATRGDLTKDGKDDAAFFLQQKSQGSGTFYYVVVVLNTPDGAVGTNAIFLGDRIAPQNVRIDEGKLSVTFAERAPGEPMTTQPSVGKSLSLTVQNSILQ